jgi:hypothetical protein
VDLKIKHAIANRTVLEQQEVSRAYREDVLKSNGSRVGLYLVFGFCLLRSFNGASHCSADEPTVSSTGLRARVGFGHALKRFE